MERDHKGTALHTIPREYVCIDVETTGLNPDFDRIIEVAAVHVIEGAPQLTFSSLIKLPEGRTISKKIEKLTGITNKMIQDAPEEEAVMAEFYQFISNYRIVGYNVNFDINFLYDACARYGMYLKNNYLDALRVAKKLLKDLHHHRLSDLAAFFKIEPTGAHRAEADALTTTTILEELRRMEPGYCDIDNPDEYWRERMLEAVKKAKLAGKHTWEV